MSSTTFDDPAGLAQATAVFGVARSEFLTVIWRVIAPGGRWPSALTKTSRVNKKRAEGSRTKEGLFSRLGKPVWPARRSRQRYTLA